MTKTPEKLTIWREESRIMVRTPEGKKPVNTKELLQEIQKFLYIDLGTHPFRIDRSHEQKGDVCPYCHSTNTIGHGSRSTLKELQIRRWCNDCNHTFVAGKEPVTEMGRKTEPNKGNIKFLMLCGLDRQEIADRLKISWNTANAQVKKLNKEMELDYLQGYYLSKKIDELIVMTRAVEFDLTATRKDTLGNTYIWDYNGRLAIGQKGLQTKVFIDKKDADVMLNLKSSQLAEYISDFSKTEQNVIITYIENKKDDMMGILPKTRLDTRISKDSGELNADLMTSGSYGSDDDKSDP